jgi:hypothetical protein
MGSEQDTSIRLPTSHRNRQKFTAKFLTLQRILNIRLIGLLCLETKQGSEGAMILKLIGLQKIIDQLFDDNWVAVWPLDKLQKTEELTCATSIKKPLRFHFWQ